MDVYAMSRADFWANMAIEATKYAKPGGPDYNPGRDALTYTWGRSDCATSPVNEEGTVDIFPDAKRGIDEVRTHFGAGSIFNLSDNEIVALIGGAHSLGKVTTTNSGLGS